MTETIDTETIEVAPSDIIHSGAASGDAALRDPGKTGEAVLLIDRHLGHLQRRELVSSTEMSDLLLDLRMLLTYVPTDSVEPAASN